jgi:DNA-binding CsgD family transcriptional regulator
MLPQSPNLADSETYPLGENTAHPEFSAALALLTISHTPVEQRLYSAMLSENSSDSPEFTTRRLAEITGIRSLSTVRRGLAGLVTKLSAQRNYANGEDRRHHLITYRALHPTEVLQRRSERGEARVVGSGKGNHAFGRAISRVSQNIRLSRREAQVALCCAEGLTNADIGKRLDVSEQTVKFHLRHIFIKFGVKRRAELISRLLT